MLSTTSGQVGFFDAAELIGPLPEGSFFALLAEHGERIVCDEDFADSARQPHARLSRARPAPGASPPRGHTRANPHKRRKPAPRLAITSSQAHACACELRKSGRRLNYKGSRHLCTRPSQNARFPA